MDRIVYYTALWKRKIDHKWEYITLMNGSLGLSEHEEHAYQHPEYEDALDTITHVKEFIGVDCNYKVKKHEAILI